MKRSAFTLIEVLAALLFLGIVVPAVLHAMTVAARASEAAERSGIAAQLAENKLEEIILGGVWNNGITGGEFGGDWPLYRWQLTTADWDQDTMTKLTVAVFYPVQGREQSVQLSTLTSSLQSATP